jgi:hypothetical protein
MSELALHLTVLKGAFALCRLSPGEAIPAWATLGAFHSITRTADELSIVVPEGSVPRSVRAQGGFRCIGVEGPFDLASVGVVASLAGPLAQGGVSLFVLSTFDTDYLLVHAESFDLALQILEGAGHRVER